MYLTKILDKVLSCHSKASINDVEGVVLFVRLDHDLEVGSSGQNVGVGQGHEPDLVQGIRGVRDQLSQEDLKYFKLDVL